MLSIQAEMRQRTPSYSPPRRSYGRRSWSPRGHYGGRSRDLPTSLLVRNIHRDCRAEDLRRPFGRFGPLKDIYLPKDYYTGDPRGFGFVQYVDPEDAAEAKYYMDGQIILGREITVVFAEENRKKPSQMRSKERLRGRIDYDYDRSPHYARSRSRSPGYSCSPRRHSSSRSYSQHDRRYREYTYSGSRSYSYSPHDRRHREYSYSRSPRYDSPVRSHSRSCGRSLSRSPSRSASRSKSYSDSSDRN